MNVLRKLATVALTLGALLATIVQLGTAVWAVTQGAFGTLVICLIFGVVGIGVTNHWLGRTRRLWHFVEERGA